MSELFTSRAKEDIMEGSYDRPAGVSIVAVIMIIGSGLLLITQLGNLGRLNDAAVELGLSSLLLQAGIGFLGLLGVAASVGLWFGKKWGWWLALFYFAYAITRNINVLISISSIAELYDVTGSEMGTHYVKYGIRMAWNGALLYYLCSENSSQYFGTAETKKWKAVLLVFALCLPLYVVGALLGR